MSFIVDISQLRKALARHKSSRFTANNRASVALILCPEPSDVELLIIRRAIRDGDPWSGHMGLPGGHRHAEDSSDRQTALREAREEVGVDLESSAEFIGSLDDVRAAAGGRQIKLIVSPFVYLVGASPSLKPNAEVADIFWISLSRIADGSQFRCCEIEFNGYNKVLPGWNIEGRIVWGLTYRIVSDLLHLVVG